MVTTELNQHRRVGGFGGPDGYFHHVSGTRPSVQLVPTTRVASTAVCSVKHGPGPGSQGFHTEAAVPPHHQGTSYTSPAASFLLPALPCHQERWPIPPGTRPLQIEQIPRRASFQDGIHSVHSLEHSGAHVGLHSRYAGCLLPRAHCLEIPRLPGFRPGWPGICLSVPSLWSGPGALGIQQNYKSCEESPPPVFHPRAFVPGRLFLPQFHSRGPSGRSGVRFGPVQEIGPLRQRQEVQPPTISESGISGCSVSPGFPQTHTAGIQGVSNRVILTGYSAPPPMLPTSSRELDGSSELGVQLHPTGQAASSSSHKVDESAYFASNKGSFDRSGRILQIVPAGVGGPPLSGALSTHVSTSSEASADDGCFEDGLVRGTTPSPSGGRLASGIGTPFLQHAGIESHTPVSSALRPSYQGKGCDGNDGQHYGRRLPPTSGLIPVGVADGADSLHPDVLLQEWHHSGSEAHLRRTECHGGPGVPTVSHSHGVVARSSDLPLASGPCRRSRGSQTSGGPLCHSPQCSSQQFCVSGAGPSSARGECSVTRLEQMVIGVPVSSGDASQQTPSVPVALRRPGYPGCSFSRKGSLVPYVDREVQRSGSSAEEPPTVSGHEQGAGVPSLPTSFAASRLDTMMAALRASGFSQDSLDVSRQAHRESTIRQYQTVWMYFLDFLARNNLSMSDVSAVTVCNFLSFHAKAFGRKYRTLAAYKSALRHPILLACGVDINSLTTDFFLRGLFNFNPPERAKGMPKWSLEDLLSYLQCPLFEPLRSAPYSKLLQKTLCLILLASGRRIGDIASLSRLSSPHPTYDALVLKWVEGYVPKFRSRRWSPSVPSVGRLASDALLCPIRAYREYLSRVSPWLVRVPETGRHPYLWVNNDRSASRMPKGQLTRWFISLVKDSRRYHSTNGTVSIGPHQCRKFAASYSVLLGQDLDRVLDVMGFSSPKIFHKNYVGPVPPLGLPCTFPGGPYNPVKP